MKNLFKPGFFILLFAVVSLPNQNIVAQNVSMYLKIGNIQGEVTAKGFENTIKVASYQNSANTTWDPTAGGGGAASGKTVFGNFEITKAWDKTSPLLYSALAKSTMFNEVILTFTTAGAAGAQATFFTIKLLDARIVNIKSAASEGDAPSETVSIAYKKIVWTHNKSSTTASWNLATNKAD